jgi:hypothetical protein
LETFAEYSYTSLGSPKSRDTSPLTRGNIVKAEYNIEEKWLTGYLGLPPDLNRHKLQEIILLYDASMPGIAYYLPSTAQQKQPY